MLKRWLPASPQMRLVLRDKAVIWVGVACLLCAVLWVGSIWVIVRFDSPSGVYYGFIDNGQVSLHHTMAGASPNEMISFERNDVYDCKYWFAWYKYGTFQEIWEIGVPLWALVLTLGLALAAAVGHAVREPDLVRCRCGYSRVGLARGSLCPECGFQAEAA